MPVTFDSFSQDDTQVASASQTSKGTIQPVSDKFNAFIDALEQAESSGGVNLFNKRTGATGPLQVTPIAVRDVGGDYSRAVEDHAYARGIGVQVAKKLWQQFDGDPSLVAAAYHTGPTAVRKLLAKVPEGEDPANWVVSQLGPEGQGHNRKVLGRLTGQLDYDPDTGRMTEANAVKMVRPKVSFDSFNSEPEDIPEKPPGFNLDTLKATFNNTVSALKNIGGTTAVLGDMFLGFPSLIAGETGGLGSAIGAAVQGADAKLAWQAGRAGAEYFKGPDWISSPLGTLFKKLHQEDTYNESLGGKAMEQVSSLIKKAGDWAEKNSDGSIPAEAVETFVNQLMIGAGARGGRAVKERTEIKGDETLGARRPRANTEVSDAEIVSENKGNLLPTPKRQASFRDFQDDANADQFIADTLKEQSAAEVADKAAKTRRLVRGGLAVSGAGALGASAAYVYNQFKSPGNELIDQGTEVPEPKPGNEVGFISDKMPGYEQMLPGLLAIGAVKGKGGMWHPEAVERLAAPLGEKIAMRSREHLANIEADQAIKYSDETLADIAKDKAAFAWSDRAIRNYLNKHAGTETDPLKDVEIPFGEGMKRWEDITDAVIKGHTKIELQVPLGPDPYGDRTYLNQVKEGEKIWRIDPKGYINLGDIGQVRGYPALESGTSALTTYLSHVGDYLRQNVDPAKLQQYDLVRAVKETAANDARVAKEMDKAATASMKDMPVYKDYGDGFKWVELKLPEKLTEEQAKGIRETTKTDIGHRSPGPAEEFVAIDSTNKPIKNNYTGYIAVGKTPEEGHLAGQLAQEGNQMGNCVGGYCEDVASGDTKIYSLRDSKGRSHVTIEVIQPGKYGGGAAPVMDVKEASIAQIKGKQNRAPSAEYLPYVQDFVKSGKWGEVGDLRNTGLTDLHSIKSSIRNDIYSTFGEQRYANDNEIRNAFPDALPGSQVYRSPRNQQGSVDLRLVKALALAGVGAAAGATLLPDDRLTAALVGGVLALGLGSAKVSSLPKLIAPGSKVARITERKIARAVETFIRSVNPDLMGKQAESAGSVMGKVVTESMRKELGIEKASIPRTEFWFRQGETRSRAFLKAYERSSTFTNPEINSYAIGYRNWMSKLSEHDISRGFTFEPVDNYVYHAWEDPEGYAAFATKKYGTKWGDPNFTKDRSFKLIEEGEAAGFKLKTWNPETLAIMRQHASNVASLKADTLTKLAKYGLAKEVEKGMKATSDETLWRSPNGKLYFLEDQPNQVMHNAFNTKSIWADKGLGGDIFRAVAYSKNILIPIQLFGLFHPMHVQLGPSFSDAMTSMTKLVAAGKASPMDLVTTGISKLALSDIWALPKLGSDYVAALRGDIPYSKLTDPQKYGLKLMAEGSFNPIMPIEYRNKHMQDFRLAVIKAQESIQHGRPLDATWHGVKATMSLPWTVLEKFYTGPIFERWIPNVKSAAYLRGAYAALMANPHLLVQPLERMNALRRVSKMVDDRFGEMNYRTLFMNRTLKDLGVVSLLSYGWQAAFVRSYLGAIPELARVFQTLGDPYKPDRLGGPEVTTTPSEISKNLELSRLAAGMKKFHENKSGFDYSSGSGIRAKIARGELDKITSLMYYVMGTMTYVGLLGYALTGQAPGQLMDYIFPLSGEKNPDGSPARLSTPFYTKDFVAYPKLFREEGIGMGALKIVGHKLNPAIGMIDSIVRNKDFFNRQIRNPDSELLSQIGQTLEFMAGGVKPMSASGPAKGPPGLKGQILGGVGFNPAPKYVTDSEIEQRIKKVYGNTHNSPVSYEQGKKGEARSELYKLKQLGQHDAFETKLEQMKQDFHLTNKEVGNLRTNAEIPSTVRLFRQLNAVQQARLLHDMTPDEQAKYRPYAAKSLRYNQ